jgi:hypothetical protein
VVGRGGRGPGGAGHARVVGPLLLGEGRQRVVPNVGVAPRLLAELGKHPRGDVPARTIRNARGCALGRDKGGVREIPGSLQQAEEVLRAGQAASLDIGGQGNVLYGTCKRDFWVK